MNVWLAKLAIKKLSKKNLDSIHNVIKSEFDISDLQNILFEYKSSGVHYLSFNIGGDGNSRKYNYKDSENRLTAYSGLLVGINPDINDYRSAESIHKHSKNPDFFDSNVSGNFAILSASELEFQCLIDNVGIHNVFYYQASDDEIYISNYIKLIKLFKKFELNTDAFLDWITLETVLLQETEENNIYTLPEYGRLTWNLKDNNLNIDQYKDVSEIVYNNTPQSSLLETVVSDFRSAGQYLTKYHKYTLTLSGGYDSRLALSMFWGLDNQEMDSYTYYDNYYDVNIAKKVAKDFGIAHKVLEFSDKTPTFSQLHDYLIKSNFPFFKYSKVFNYLVKNSLENVYQKSIVNILIKGGGGNSDRRIIEKNFLDNFEEDEAISKLAESTLESISSTFFNRDSSVYMQNRVESHFRQKYLSIISGRGKNHKLKCLLFKIRENNTTNRINRESQTLFDNVYLPLTMDSFQTLIFNCKEKDLHRWRKGSVYHRLNNSFTLGEEKPIHFTSGLHWEANKLSRGFHRLKHQIIQKKLANFLNHKEKKTTQIKTEFYIQNRSQAMEILHYSKNSFLWDYFDQDAIIKHFQNSTDYENDETQFIFKNLLPVLKLEQDGMI